VVGWTDPEGTRPFLGALLLAYYDPEGQLIYAGRRKQTGKARQAFMRSARQAGFFAHGEDRLVRPPFPPGGPGTRPVDLPSGDNQNKGKVDGRGGSGGDGTPPRHPLIEGMFQSLPANGQPWTLDEAADWLHAAAYNLRFASRLKGKITIDIKIEPPTETP
jgi:hypothetical protein